jgi:transcriptional regulator with XRE-family HTH domain
MIGERQVLESGEEISRRVGVRLKTYRGVANKRIRDISEASDIKAVLIDAFEDGRRTMNLHHLSKLSNVTGIPVVELVKPYEPHDWPMEEAKLIWKLSELNMQSQEVLRRLYELRLRGVGSDVR